MSLLLKDGERMKDFIHEFKTKVYEKSAQNLIVKTDKQIAANENIICQSLFTEVEKQLKRVAVFQQQKILPNVSYMSFSVLYTSVYFKRPQMRLDFYNKDWTVTEPLYTTYLDIKWLFSYWDYHYHELEKEAKKLDNNITERYIQQTMWQSVRLLTYLLSQRFKYWSYKLTQSMAFDMLGKNEEFFITVGEYLDWQDIVYATLPEIDIFDRNINDSLQQRDFFSQEYEKKIFINLDMSHSRFYNCIFKACTFENCILNDCILETCSFQDVDFINSTLYGITAKHTLWENITFKNSRLGVEENEENLLEIYKPSEFIYCSITNLKMVDSCFNDVSLYGGVVKQIEKVNTSLINSDFA